MRRYGLGIDKDGDRWFGPFMWQPIEVEQNHSDRSTTYRFKLWWVRRWLLQVSWTRSWKEAEE